jgi:hypothetical protein
MIAAAYDEADRRDPQRVRQWVFLVDGNKQQITAIETPAAGPLPADDPGTGRGPAREYPAEIVMKATRLIFLRERTQGDSRDYKSSHRGMTCDQRVVMGIRSCPLSRSRST